MSFSVGLPQLQSLNFTDVSIYLWHSKCPFFHAVSSGVLPCLSIKLTFAPLCTSSLTQSKLPLAAALWRAVSPDELGLLIYHGFSSKRSCSSDTEFWLAAARIKAYMENVTCRGVGDGVDCEPCWSRRRHDFTGINSVLFCLTEPVCSTLTILRRFLSFCSSPLLLPVLFVSFKRSHSPLKRKLSEQALRILGPSLVLFQIIDIPSLSFMIFGFLSSVNRFLSPFTFFMKFVTARSWSWLYFPPD